MGFLRLLESVRVPALDTLFSGITYFGDELAFLALALLLSGAWTSERATMYLWWGFSGRWQTSS